MENEKSKHHHLILHIPISSSSIVNEAIETIYLFIFFMKRLIHANKTLSTYTLKTQGYLYTFYASSCFFKDLRTNIKNKVPKNVYSLVGLASKNKNI